MGAERNLRLSGVLVSAFLIVGSGMPAFAQAGRVDHSQADVNGRSGVALWPSVNDTPGDPKGYEVVLARLDRPESWLRFPAGKWQEVPPGQYWVLLEGPFELTPHPNLLHWSNPPYEGRGMAGVRRTVAAGRVHLDGDCGSKECLAWLLHESSNLEGSPGYYQPEMLRWAPLQTARTNGVLMPAGRIATALYDAARKEFVAIHVPGQVTPRAATRVRPLPPRSGRAALILEMARPSPTPKVVEKDVRVALVAGGVTLRPAFIARTHKKIIAIWTDVAAGPVSVEVSSTTARLPQSDLRLRSGKIEHASLALAAPPKLGLRWSIPDAFEPKDPTLKVTNVARSNDVQTIQLAGKTSPIELEVPAAPLEVILKSGPWSVRETVDLSDGIDRSIEVQMRAIRVSGRVYYGDQGIEAAISFRTDVERKELQKVKTDRDGNFEALFARPGAYTAWVDLEGRAAPYAVLGFDVQGDTTRDIRIPANEYRFRVTRKDDGRPIEGARISIDNREDSPDDLVVSQEMRTDARGAATTQPLRPGTMSVTVRADGYERLDRPEEVVVAGAERTIDLQLEAVGPADTLTLVLADGRPATGAKVMVHTSRVAEKAADADGRVHVPRADAGGLVLVRAPGAALTARTWPGGDQTWTLDPPAEPLVIHSVRADGSTAPHARAMLWLDGVRLTGLPLAWLTSKGVMTDGAGYWVLHDLPRRPIQVLMWHGAGSNHELVRQERLDAMRTTIRWPWPASVDVKILD